ncbi:MAG: phosphoribosylamine--glycine ligase [Patescibacteria group bacterium]
MRILLIGSGGREHALAWKLKQSLKVSEIFIAPGNAGTSSLGMNIEAISTNEIIAWVGENPIDLVIVGPDSYLAEGLVDMLEKKGIKVFGPTKAAAEIEWSKAFAKEFMRDLGIPTAKFSSFDNSQEAKNFLSSQKFPIVIKADGLATGKGVIIALNIEEGQKAIREIMDDKIFGSSGNKIIIEEYLEGVEISTHAFCDGFNVVMFPAAQDHKRIFENDQGPNTGGMGTIAPVPGISNSDMKEIKEKIVLPTLNGLRELGRPFKGVLFPGIMLTKEGPKVIEFNAKFGDPETQVYMCLLDTDLLEIILACIEGKLSDVEVKWSDQYACCVVCASSGYPRKYEVGKRIKGLDKESDGAVIFHAGTKLKNGEVVTDGGRVLGVTSVGETLSEAINNAYSALNNINFEGMYYRKDIGAKSLKRAL